MSKKIFSLCLFCFLASCAGQSPAPIEYGNLESGGGELIKSRPIKEKEVSLSRVETEPAGEEKINRSTTEDLGEPKPRLEEKTIYREVEKGETIESLAKEYGKSVEEIASLNYLNPPYDLEEGQIIKIKLDKNLLNAKNDQASLPHSVKAPEESGIAEAVPTEGRGGGAFLSPVSGKIITKFGEKNAYGVSSGADIETAPGATVKSIAPGKVIYSGYDKKFGNIIIVKIENSDLTVAYARLGGLLLAKGDSVTSGENVGQAAGGRVHIAFRQGKTPVDPLKYVNFGG